MEMLLGDSVILEDVCTDIIMHYEDNRQYEVSGKAMIVAYSRSVAINMYKKILDLRSDWSEKVKVVMSGDNRDPPEWQDIIGTDSYKRELERKFKDDNDPMQIAIVVDMWFTGFDVASLATMYIYKPMNLSWDKFHYCSNLFLEHTILK